MEDRESQDSNLPQKQVMSWQKLSKSTSEKLWNTVKDLQQPGEALMKKEAVPLW